MPLPPDLDLNGYTYSHASVDARLYGIRTKGVKELAFKPVVERGSARGTAREDLAHTVGTVKYEASATFLRSAWEAIKEDCRTKGFAPMDRPGLFSITIAEPGKASVKVEIRISGLTEADSTSADGPDAHTFKVTMSVLMILENGRPLVSRSLYTGGAI